MLEFSLVLLQWENTVTVSENRSLIPEDAVAFQTWDSPLTPAFAVGLWAVKGWRQEPETMCLEREPQYKEVEHTGKHC